MRRFPLRRRLISLKAIIAGRKKKAPASPGARASLEVIVYDRNVVTCSAYFPARNALCHAPHASPRAFTFTPTSASSLALAAATNSPAALLRFLASLANWSDFSQIASVALVLPCVLPFGKR